MRTAMTLAVLAAVTLLTCCACSNDSSDDKAAPETSHSALVETPDGPEVTDAPEETVTAENAEPTEETPKLFPGHDVRQTDEGVIATKASWGADWPWKTSDVTMGCGDAIGGGAYLNAADGKNYLLSGTISQQGFVDGNAGTNLWDQRSTDVFAEWQEAADTLCPAGA